MPRSSKVTAKKAASGVKTHKANTEPNMEELQAMIAEAAYFKAEHRNFTPGFEELDWFEAEQEINSMMANQ